jgi:protein-tyrosine-phosphatase
LVTGDPPQDVEHPKDGSLLYVWGSPPGVATSRKPCNLAGQRAKHFDEFLDQRFDCVVTVCDRVREVCPEFPGARTIHWSIPDPAEGGDDATTYPAFERTAADLAARIPFLVQLLAHDLVEVN